MKAPDAIMIKDKKSGKFFAFVSQFPGICAQGDSFEEASSKVNTYYKTFIEKMRGKDIVTNEDQVLSM